VSPSFEAARFAENAAKIGHMCRPDVGRKRNFGGMASISLEAGSRNPLRRLVFTQIYISWNGFCFCARAAATLDALQV
jgi:hypothetical protein